LRKKKQKLISLTLEKIVVLRRFLLSGFKIFILKPYWRDNLITTMFFLSALINALNWIFLLKNQKNSDYPIILHYNLFFGVDYLGDYNKIYTIPFVGVIIITINTILGHLLYRKEKLASYFLSFNTFIIQTFLLFASYLVIKINL